MTLHISTGSHSPLARGWADRKTPHAVASLLMSWMFVVCCAGIASGQDDLGRKAFSKKKYPWYNAQSDQVERVEMNDRPPVRSWNRKAIPLRPIKNPPKNAGRWNFGNWGGFIGGLSIFAWVLIAILILAVIGVLFWAFLRMEPNVPEVDDVTRRRSMDESIKQLPFDLDSDSGDFRQAAQNGYLAGDYRKAIIYLFSHVLVTLDQKGHIRLRKGKTNRQYLHELRPFRPLSDFYQRVMVPFEATFFGDHELGKLDFENCWNRLDEFQRDVERTSQVAHG